jgi:anaerobic magnesium-protoporphyrin IX monomethyl ester cyclase
LFIEEINKKEKFELIEQLQLNHHKNRYVVLPIHFNWEILQTENRIVLNNENLIIEYNGVDKVLIIQNKFVLQ